MDRLDRFEFGELLQSYLYRQDRNMRWLAARLRVSPSTVTRWCNGETRPRDPETVLRIAEELGIRDAEERNRLLAAAGYAASIDPVPVPGSGVPETPDPGQRSGLPSPRPLSPQALLVGLLALGILGGLGLWWMRSLQGGATPSPQALPMFAPSPAAQIAREEPGPIDPVDPPVSVCGETERLPTPPWNRFLRTQGVSLFTPGDTEGGVWNPFPRVLAIDRRGLWIGYFGRPGMVGHYDGRTWAYCTAGVDFPVENVNALVVDPVGRVWVGMEKQGVMVYDGQAWRGYTSANGLPSDEIFGLTVDPEGRVWALTWEGVARFDGDRWSVPYSVHNGTLLNNRTIDMAFDPQGNIWIGYIRRGLSRFNGREGVWEHYRAGEGTIGGDAVRDILVHPSQEGAVAGVWFATADGGVTRYMDGTWTTYTTEDGLPSNTVHALAVDRYGRVWAATQGGTVYYDGDAWQRYTTLPTYSLAFGPPCGDCPFDEDDVWTGVPEQGLTHSGLPLADPAIEVVAVQVPETVAPGQEFRPAITVMPLWPYRLEPGDFLAHTDPDERLRFGAWPHMAVTQVVEPGQPYTFTDYDNPFVAPELPPDRTEQTFTSTWRVWMDNRFVGPPIPIPFTVRQRNAGP